MEPKFISKTHCSKKTSVYPLLQFAPAWKLQALLPSGFLHAEEAVLAENDQQVAPKSVSFHVPFFQPLPVYVPKSVFFSPFLSISFQWRLPDYLCAYSQLIQNFLPVFVLLNVSFLEIGTTVHFKQKGMVLISDSLLYVKIKSPQQYIGAFYTQLFPVDNL